MSSVKIQCNICGSNKAVEKINFNDTFIFDCTECMNVQVVYCLPTDLNNLKEYIKLRDIKQLHLYLN